jgi:hypothetical protein
MFPFVPTLPHRCTRKWRRVHQLSAQSNAVRHTPLYKLFGWIADWESPTVCHRFLLINHLRLCWRWTFLHQSDKKVSSNGNCWKEAKTDLIIDFHKHRVSDQRERIRFCLPPPWLCNTINKVYNCAKFSIYGISTTMRTTLNLCFSVLCLT